MKLVHMRSRKGRRGHKWFPGSDRGHRLAPPSQAAGLVATILALFGGRR